MAQTIALEPGGGQAYWVLGERCDFKATSAQTDGAYALVEMEALPGQGSPPHIHHREQESFYVLEGTLALYCNGERTEARPGAFVSIPPGSPHYYTNESAEKVRFLVHFVPGGFEAFFAEIGAPIQNGEAPPPVTEAVITKIREIAADYAMEIVG